MSRSTVTPLEALRRLIAACKLIDFADCKDETVWQALADAQGVAEGVVRDHVKQPTAYIRPAGLDNLKAGRTAVVYPCYTDSERSFCLYAIPVAAQPSEASPDWKDRLYAAMDAEFKLRSSAARDEDGQRIGMRRDDTQIGVEFAMRWVEKNMLAAPTAAVSAAPSGEVERKQVGEVRITAGKTWVQWHALPEEGMKLFATINEI